MARHHILLADDETQTLVALDFILEAADYTVSTARNGLEALEKIEEISKSGDEIDLLVTDIHMPGMDGRELLERVRSIHPAMPVLVISGTSSGWGRGVSIRDFPRDEQTRFMIKPIDEVKILEEIAHLLDG